MDTITLLRDFTGALSPNDVFRTDWVHFPADHKNADLRVHCQTLTPGAPSTGLTITLESTFDTVGIFEVGTGINIAATGVNGEALSSDLAPMVRVKVENKDTVAIMGTMSVWLQPKSD